MKQLIEWWKNLNREWELNKAPVDLDSAVAKLISKLSPEAISSINSSSGKYGGFDGMYIRNSWGLWIIERPLTQWFRRHGIWHADDMSAIIFDAAICKIRGQPFDITKRAKFYEEYWAKIGFGFDSKHINPNDCDN